MCQLIKWQEGSGESVWVGVMIKKYRRISWKSWWMWRMSGGIVWNMDRRFQFQISNWKRWKQQRNTWRMGRQVYQLLLLLKGWRQSKCCLKLLAKVFNEVLSESKWLGDWILTSLIPIFKGKGIWTQLLDKRLIEIVNIVWKGTVDAVFVLRRFTKKFRSKGKKLFYVFVDLEKTFNLVPQKVTWWVLKIKGDPENLVHGIMSLYNDCKTAVSVDGELSESFVVQVGVHQGSVLSPLLFIVTDLLT